jgi:hypothetical protein
MTSFMLPGKFANITENFAFDVKTDHIYWTDGTGIYLSLTNESGKDKFI